jgi:hypothetical protein
MNAENFVVGQPAEFVYHNKPRKGVVETVEKNFVRLEVEGDPDKAIKFKSFNYNKIQVVNTEVQG